ncbi:MULTISPECIES: nSTAND1 domain-containing NTPase [Niastella]|uniref:Restriction endonuclease n=1 Tax=Niastella soli TaxID=2821487 RepID=A0ABS3YZ90_9BACT|nr:restriction endonuclease [Niastella soli]MBO9203241.1 restriction endonuclease [Niastella soli]
MINEVKIVLEPEINKSANGSVLEHLIRDLLERQHYEVNPNVHFTGLEIDLLAKHKYKNETLYVECKAKEKPKSTEIKTFIFGVDYGISGESVDYGYFIHTEELDRQASALKLQFENSKKNVSFIGPDKIIELLIESGRINKLNYNELSLHVSKTILAYTYFGIFYVLFFQENAIAENFTIIDAKTLITSKDDSVFKVTDSVKEVKDLNFIQLAPFTSTMSGKQKIARVLDNVTEIKESENWYDYSPASIKHFIGRASLRDNLLALIEQVRQNKTQNRIFYLDGKSGWGKSSVIAELRGRTRTKFLKKKAFTLAVDTRSASTNSFIALAFKKLIDDAKQNGFISQNLFSDNIKFASPYDILSDNSIKQILSILKSQNKVLIIVFDQFEDVFRKEDLFEAFYKFLIDVNDAKENVIVGFSWKSEINIPIGNAAYHQFSQIKDYALNLKIPEFGLTDVKNVINQLSKEIKKPLGNDLERRLIDASQGFPWLIKKLCIHTYQQYTNGKTLEELIEQDLNIKSLFDSDLEKLTAEESNTLNYIARRSYSESALDISELENIDEEALHQLIHKRLVINTGSKYNIYWDIFRDYLVNGDIPVIGESYLIRQSYSGCLQLYLSFAKNMVRTFEEISNEHSKTFTKKTLFNILFELRSFGLLRKKENSDIYEITDKSKAINKIAFIEYITEKLKNYTPYIELAKLDRKKITVDDIVFVLKGIFKTSDFKEKTWKAYALNLMTWLTSTNLPIKDKIVESRKGRSANYEFNADLILYISPQIVVDSIKKLQNGEQLSNRVSKELVILKIATQLDESTLILNDWANVDCQEDLFLKGLAETAISFNKVQAAYQFLKEHPSAKPAELLARVPELTKDFKTELSKRQINSILFGWGLFVVNVLDNNITKVKIKRTLGKIQNKYAYTPDQLIDCYLRFMGSNSIDSIEEDRKISYLRFQGILDGKQTILDNAGISAKLKEVVSEDQFIEKVAEYLLRNPKPKLQDVLDAFPEAFINYSTKASQSNRWSKISSWARLVI